MPTLHWLTRDEDIYKALKVPYRLLEESSDLSAGESDTGNMLEPWLKNKTMCVFSLVRVILDSRFRGNDEGRDGPDRNV